MFDLFYQNNDPINANGLIQKFENRFVVQNPPNFYLENEDLDAIYEMDFENDFHPIHKNAGILKGIETTKSSVTTHRGCFGECNFCAIAIHQGRKIRSRSEKSILNEVKKHSFAKNFNGIIKDLGGATANMYKMECENQAKNGSCKNRRCFFPKKCNSLKINHLHHLKLLKAALEIPKIKRVFISSGLRYDLIQNDENFGNEYLNFVVQNCVSGQMKIAPEHTEKKVLDLMGKIGKPQADLEKFNKDFYQISKNANKKQFLTYYLIAGHPGCSINEMKKMREFLTKKFNILPEQIQIFTPTPSTYSTLMYYTEKSYIYNSDIFVEKNPAKLKIQKEIVVKS
jgi:uncharacterized radical SAM protein YgiQ